MNTTNDLARLSPKYLEDKSFTRTLDIDDFVRYEQTTTEIHVSFHKLLRDDYGNSPIYISTRDGHITRYIQTVEDFEKAYPAIVAESNF